MEKARIQDDRVRQRLFLMRLAEEVGVRQACLQMGKHLSYYYYWSRRYTASGRDWRSLRDRSSRPRRMPRLSDTQTVNRVLKLRQRTGYGKARLAQRLGLPVSTVGHILRRAQVTRPLRKWPTQKKHRQRYELLYPGQRVQMDVKYVPFRIQGKRYYQYTVIDECTRLRYTEIKECLWSLYAPEVLQKARRYFGFPIECVQTDNGTEFTFRYTAVLQAKHKKPKEHPLDTYCRRQGIRHRCIPPGEKELNGKVERSHRTDMEEFYNRYDSKPTAQQLRTDAKRWLHYYNGHRPHSSINNMTPWAFAKRKIKQCKQPATVDRRST